MPLFFNTLVPSLFFSQAVQTLGSIAQLAIKTTATNKKNKNNLVDPITHNRFNLFIYISFCKIRAYIVYIDVIRSF